MKRACVIGWPIEHSRSPLIHSYWLKKYGIDGAYTKEAVPPEAVTQFLRSLAQNGFVDRHADAWVAGQRTCQQWLVRRGVVHHGRQRARARSSAP